MTARPLDDDLRIRQITVFDLDLPLHDDFTISQGTLRAARVAYVRLSLHGGVTGYGEIAPFPDLTGEDRDESHRVAEGLAELLIDQPVSRYRRLSELMHAAAPESPAARCGLETALLDALARALQLPLWALWGGAGAHLSVQTDITLPILDAGRTLELALQWYTRGFRRLKTKVGVDRDQDRERMEAIVRALPDVRFILDANQGFTQTGAIAFMREMLRLGADIELFEQPVPKDDLVGMAAVRSATGVPVAADESVATVENALRVVQCGAADVINLKIMKSGVLEVPRIAAVARAAGKRLMIGGMMETRLAMGCSLALVYGLGGIDFVDLDTPLLLATDPLRGGYEYDGPWMSLWHEPGLGMHPE
jgi:L-alanine-DL-glutamate epimerase-like enolase superfamily enzyme